jgi:hypothetical protein
MSLSETNLPLLKSFLLRLSESWCRQKKFSRNNSVEIFQKNRRKAERGSGGYMASTRGILRWKTTRNRKSNLVSDKRRWLKG